MLQDRTDEHLGSDGESSVCEEMIEEPVEQKKIEESEATTEDRFDSFGELLSIFEL